ncbi:hypothetical protein IKQ21_04020 [bacterium]|nr:hypothetical protein [bacterium]
MLDSVKQFITLISVDKLINDKNYELALEKLNELIQNGFRLDETYLKRGILCRKLLMNEDAYSDFTYVISHYENTYKAHEERMFLNCEIKNYPQAVTDAEYVLGYNPENAEANRIKILSLIYSEKYDLVRDYMYSVYNNNKYKCIRFLLNESAVLVAKDEFSNALNVLNTIELFDKDNPIKLFSEANIYSLAGDIEKQNELMSKIDSVFPKYFISHFKFGDIYEDRDLLEVCFLLELRVFDKQNLFAYPMTILEGYKNNLEGKIIDSKECFERAVQINPNKAEAYVLLGETLQLMSGYDNPEFRAEAQKNYETALEIYEQENLVSKADAMKRQIRHLNSGIFEHQKI